MVIRHLVRVRVVISNPIIAGCIRYNIILKGLSVTCDRFVVFSVPCTNKTDRHDITDILLKVTLNAIAITLTPCPNRLYQKTNI